MREKGDRRGERNGRRSRKSFRFSFTRRSTDSGRLTASKSIFGHRNARTLAIFFSALFAVAQSLEHHSARANLAESLRRDKSDRK
jgi:hypothetical protein